MNGTFNKRDCTLIVCDIRFVPHFSVTLSVWCVFFSLLLHHTPTVCGIFAVNCLCLANLTKYELIYFIALELYKSNSKCDKRFESVLNLIEKWHRFFSKYIHKLKYVMWNIFKMNMNVQFEDRKKTTTTTNKKRWQQRHTHTITLKPNTDQYVPLSFN